MMKRNLTLILVVYCFASISCRAGKGCPSNGKNVGAERVLSADAKTSKSIKRAGKFKS